jgi:hypothetical protein
MADQTVHIEQDSRERVALDLMKYLAGVDKRPKDIAYFFKLYRQCYKATAGYEVKAIQEED